VGPFSYHLHPGESVGYDIVAAYNVLRPPSAGETPLTEDDLWLKRVTRDFWAQAPVSCEAEFIIYEAANVVGVENVCILTKPTRCPESLSGKFDWITSKMPHWLHEQYLIGWPKAMCSHPDAVLIDDSDTNVINWRKKGGKAILVPRPWNSLRNWQTYPYLVNAFRALEAMKGFE
jgi:hypothetical protein